MTTITVHTASTAVTATHLLPGEGYTWVEAKAITMPWGEAGWEFKNGDDCVRWLRSEIE